MMELYYFSLCPFSRIARVILEEKKIDYVLKNEKYWERRVELAKLNPAYELPVLACKEFVISDINSILEFLDEQYPVHPLFYRTPIERAEQRRLISWYNKKLYQEVTRHIINERVIRFFEKKGYPNTQIIRSAKSNFEYHFDYLAFLLHKRTWLAGEKFSICDIVAACQISVLDYLGEVNWTANESVRNWYSIIKSKPSFRKILEETVVGFTPPEHYTLLDF
jgi:glutathione S-transferase